MTSCDLRETLISINSPAGHQPPGSMFLFDVPPCRALALPVQLYLQHTARSSLPLFYLTERLDTESRASARNAAFWKEKEPFVNLC